MTWFAIAGCLMISFIFSGIEAGILSLNRVRLRHRLKIKDPAAIKLQRLLAQPERLFVTVLLVTNFMNICALILAAQEFVRRFGNIGYVMAAAVALPIYLLGLELLPKSLFRRFPYRALAALSEPLRLIDLLLSPLFAVVWWLVKPLVAQKSEQPKKLFVAREDFKYFTIESERQGTLTKVERQMIHNVVDFRKIRAKEVMVPMEKVRAVSSDATTAQVLQIFRETKVDRLPVVSASGEITGLVNVFEVLVEPLQSEKVSAYQRRIVTAGENEEAYHVIRKLRAARSTLAAVVDASAKPLGIVSSEDLLNRLVNTAVA